MKSLITFFLTICLVAIEAAGQDSLQVQPSPVIPGSEYERPGVPDENEQKEDRIALTAEELPPAIRDAMEKSDKFTGWRTGAYYYEKNTDEYLIHILQDTGTETFRFDKEGNAILERKPIVRPSSEH